MSLSERSESLRDLRRRVTASSTAPAAGQKDFGLFYKTRGDAFDVKERHALHEGVDGIDDVIQIADEGVDVFAVEWGDEGAVEPIEGGIAEIVGLVFFIADHLDGGVDAG